MEDCKNFSVDEMHCHNKYGSCVMFIDDCQVHYDICTDNCHQECGCQNP